MKIMKAAKIISENGVMASGMASASQHGEMKMAAWRRKSKWRKLINGKGAIMA
jgi:hypothetical protein